jgi:SmpA / OmlA family
MTKEIQMTNDAQDVVSFRVKSRVPSTALVMMPLDPSTPLHRTQDNDSALELRHSFVIRHLSFVIRLILVLMLLLMVDSCIGKRITKANVDQVTEGMSKKQVESILGQPTSSKTEDPTIIRQTTYVYRQGKDTVTIVFRDDKVQSKDSTLSN